MQWCTANALLSVSNNKLEACFTLWAATNSFSASFCELRHSGFSSLCPWQILVVVVFVGPCPVRFFSVQRLQGFRQVVQHVLLHVAKQD